MSWLFFLNDKQSFVTLQTTAGARVHCLNMRLE